MTKSGFKIYVMNLIYQLVQFAPGRKNSDKILTDSVKAGKKRIRMHLSKYKDVELALLYWTKDMQSRDHPPPLSKGILEAKAEQYVHYIVFDGY